MRGTLGLVLAGLAVGIGVGYLVGAGGGQRERASRPTTNIDDPPAPRPSTVKGATVHDPSPVVGTGVIRGRVATVEGEAVSVALIVATAIRKHARSSYRRGRGGPPRQSADEAVREFTENYRWIEARKREGRTGDDGTYAITGLPDASFQLIAYAKGYVVRAKPGYKAWEVKSGAVVDFVATPVFDVAVDVFLPGGGRATEARIRWKTERHNGREEWSAEEPTIQLNAGGYEVFAVGGENEDLKSESQKIELVPRKTPPGVVFHLKWRPGLRGRVVVPDELVVPHVTVYALRFAGDELPAGEQLARSRLRQTAREGDGYKYQLRDLEPGRYAVGVKLRDSRRAEGAEIVEVVDRMVDKDLRLPAPDPARHLVVRVLDADGKPLRGLRFMQRYEAKRWSSSGPSTTFERKDGSYLIRPFDAAAHGGPAGGTYTLKFSARDHGSFAREFDPAVGELVIRLNELALLKVAFENYVGSGLQGKLFVDIKPAPVQVKHSYSPKPVNSPESEFDFGRLEPGDYVLTLLVRAAHGFHAVAHVPLRLDRGANTVPVRVPALHTLTVVYGKSDDPVWLGLKLIEGWSISRATNTQGRAVFELLPAGRYEVSGERNGEARKIVVAVPAQSEVRFP